MNFFWANPSIDSIARRIAADQRRLRQWDSTFEKYAVLQQKLVELAGGAQELGVVRRGFVGIGSKEAAQRIWEIDDLVRGTYMDRK